MVLATIKKYPTCSKIYFGMQIGEFIPRFYLVLQACFSTSEPRRTEKNKEIVGAVEFLRSCIPYFLPRNTQNTRKR